MQDYHGPSRRYYASIQIASKRKLVRLQTPFISVSGIKLVKVLEQAGAPSRETGSGTAAIRRLAENTNVAASASERMVRPLAGARGHEEQMPRPRNLGMNPVSLQALAMAAAVSRPEPECAGGFRGQWRRHPFDRAGAARTPNGRRSFPQDRNSNA